MKLDEIGIVADKNVEERKNRFMGRATAFLDSFGWLHDLTLATVCMLGCSKGYFPLVFT